MTAWRRFVPRVPAPALPRGYRRPWLGADLVAAATVIAYLVPQVMAYATVAGLPPVAGLWAVLPAIAAYALFGSSTSLSMGPESTTALMTATVIAPLAGGDPARYAGLAAALALATGGLCLIAWLLRLSFVADLLSRPVLVGYLAGVALIMIVDQLPKLTGVPGGGDGFFGQVAFFVSHLGEANPGTVAVAAAALLFLIVVDRFVPRAPGPLLAVALATAAVVAFHLKSHGIAVIGRIPAGLPGFSPPGLEAFDRLLVPALGVLLVAYTDVILTGRAFEKADREDLDAGRELLALGAANVGSSLLQGFPVSSSASRTALASSAGARSQVYSLAAGAGIVGVLLFLGPLLSSVPSALLGALVVYAAAKLIDVRGFRRLAAFRYRELLLALACLAGVLALDILYGVLVAAGLSVAELLARVARPHDGILGLVPGMAGMHDVDDYPQARTIPGLLVYRYDSPLFFANAQDFKRRALAAADQGEDPVSWFVLNAEANVEVDITALDALEALRAELTGRGIVFALARVKQDLRTELDAYGLTRSVGEGLIFPTLPSAVSAYEAWRIQRAEPAGASGRPTSGGPPPHDAGRGTAPSGSAGPSRRGTAGRERAMKHREVSSVMTSADRVVSVRPDTPYKDIVALLYDHRISAVPVVGADMRVLGVVSEADLLAEESRLEAEPHGPTPGRGGRRERVEAAGEIARDVMTSPAATVGPAEDVVRAARVMAEHGVRCLVVTDSQGVLAGMVSRGDILGLFTRADEDIRRDIEQDVVLGMLWLNPKTLDIRVEDGVVRLGGRVDTRSLAGIVGHVVRRTDGVVDVVNDLEYDRDDSATRPARSGPYGIFEHRGRPD